jgi:NAD(P)-dependent dehydrogenase (short-subunit alcohol dehydrogenase family)
MSGETNALVIGAGGGVGAATAALLLAQGYSVHASVSAADKIPALHARLPGLAGIIALDLSQGDEALERLQAYRAAQAQKFSAVVVCAAVAPQSAAEFTSLDVLRRAVEINCVSALAVYRALMPDLRATRGRMVLVSSFSGKVAMPLQAPYVASKFALEGLADVLRQEAGPCGVEIILLQPGGIDTAMARLSASSARAQINALQEPELSLYGNLYKQFEYRVLEALAANSLTPPEVVAQAALHALEMDKPQPRYPVGADATQLLAAARQMTDRELDALVLGIYQSVPV